MTPLLSPWQETLDAQTAYVKSVTVTATRADVTHSFEPESGQITHDARRSMRWDGTLNLPVEDLWLPTVPGDLLTPFGTIVTIRLGLYLASGVMNDVPYGAMTVDGSDVQLTASSRSVNLTLIDLADRLAKYRFETPYEIPASTDIADAVNMVVLDRLGEDPQLDTTGNLTPRIRVFGLDPELDPWRELEELVSDFGYRLYYDRSGNLILDQPPIPNPNTAVPLNGELTVAGVFDHRPPNVLVVRGEPSDDTPPVQSVAYDDDTASPTYAGAVPGQSAYGRVTRFYASPLITTQGQADLAAQNLLAQSAAAAATWSVTKAYDPTVDPDDVRTIPLDASTNLPLVVDAVTVDIAGSTTMQARAVSQLS